MDVEEIKAFIGERIETLHDAADSLKELGYMPSVNRVKRAITELELLLRYIEGDKNAYNPKDDEPLEPLPPVQND